MEAIFHCTKTAAWGSSAGRPSRLFKQAMCPVLPQETCRRQQPPSPLPSNPLTKLHTRMLTLCPQLSWRVDKQSPSYRICFNSWDEKSFWRLASPDISNLPIYFKIVYLLLPWIKMYIFLGTIHKLWFTMDGSNLSHASSLEVNKLLILFLIDSDGILCQSRNR